MSKPPFEHASIPAPLRAPSRRVELRAPASEDDLRAMAAAASRPLPDDYVSFLRVSDGAAGWIGRNYIDISPAGQAAGTTTALHDFVPGLFFFAGDGAEGLFAFDLRTEDGGIVITHADDLELDGLVRVADSFTALLRFLEDHDWIEFWSAERSHGRDTR